jgi:Fe-S-cluster-containing hydrogenase component 2
MLVDLEDKTIAVVKEEHRKKVRYTCAKCKPELNNSPCVLFCPEKAVKCIWSP